MFLLLILVGLSVWYFYNLYLENQTIENLNKKCVLITGCDTGFGHDLAIKCYRNDITVLAACLTENGVKDLKDKSKNKIVAFVMNVTSDDSVSAARDLVEKTALKYGGLHGIVNNAGITGNSLWDDFLNVQDYQDVFNVNLLGIVRVTHAFMDLVKKAKGRIVNTASICGRIALPSLGPYTVSKYGVEAYSDTIRVENAVFGIKVSIIEPGFFATGLTEPDRILKMAKNVWNRGSNEMRKEYGEDTFDNAMKEMVIHLNKSSKDTHLVVDAYYHALTSVKPKKRYNVGKDSKFGYVFEVFKCVLIFLIFKAIFRCQCVQLKLLILFSG